MCGSVVDILAVLHADQLGCFRRIERAAVEARKYSAPNSREIRAIDARRLDRIIDVARHPGSGPPAPVDLLGRFAGREEIHETVRIVSHELRDYREGAAAVGARGRRAIDDVAIGHHPAMASSAVLMAERQPLRSRDPSKPEDGARIVKESDLYEISGRWRQRTRWL